MLNQVQHDKGRVGQLYNRVMNVHLVSYNLWFHKAYKEVSRLAEDQATDLICLQECYPSELQERLGSLRLAGSHNYVHQLPLKHRGTRKGVTAGALKGDVGMALYYNTDKLTLEDITSLPLHLPWQERNGGRIMQLARFSMRLSGEKLVVVNVHLSALLAPNRARRKQLLEMIKHINDYRGSTPVILAGDFNYPIAAKGLQKLMEGEGFTECGTHDASPTHTSRLVKGKFDRIFVSPELHEQNYAILPFGVSDHAPIVATVEF